MVDWILYAHDLEAQLRAAREEIAALANQVTELKATIERLEARLRQNSQNSSRPPSQDGLRFPLRGKKEKSGRPPGGQPGHPGKARDLVPHERVDRTEDRDPVRCGHCGGETIKEAPRLDAVVRQITEVPEVRALVTEFRLWRKRCPDCGEFALGEMPPGSPTGAFGPRLQAVVALLTGMFGLSRRDVVELLGTLLDVDLCVGSIQACCETASEAGAETVQELHELLKVGPSVHVDETTFGKEGDRKRWLWIIASGDTEAFLLQNGRGKKEAAALLGEGYSGVLIRDRLGVYEGFEGLGKASSQLCHAHLRREFKALAEMKGKTQEMGKALLSASNRIFHEWHRFKNGEITRRDFQILLVPIQEEFLDWFEWAQERPGYHADAVKLGRDLSRQWDWLWTFAFRDNVEPTNNRAETGLRRAVIWRKTSFGAHSDPGCRFVERILSLAGTARRRGVGFLDWMIRTIQARLDGLRAPPLIPV